MTTHTAKLDKWTSRIENILGQIPCHKTCPKHLERYIQELAGRHNIREHDTTDQMTGVASVKAAKQFSHSELTAGNARS